MTTDARERRLRRLSWARVSIAQLVNLAVLAVMVVAVLLRDGTGSFVYPGTPLLVFTILGWLPLLVRTRWPLPVLVATVLVSALQLILVPHLDPVWKTAVGMAEFQPIPIAVAVAAYTVAVRARRRTGWVAGCVAAGVLPLIALATTGADYVWTCLVMCNLILDGTVAGVLVAARRDRLVREERAQAERTRREVEAERLRIARELHDVLAHHLTLVNAQAGVADYLFKDDPDAAGKALGGLAKHTRQALDELRATVGLLREDPTSDGPDNRPPLPTLAELPQLVHTVHAAGVTVDLNIHGQPQPMPPGADLAAYRLVQEGLTNAARHAPGTPITVDLTWHDHQLAIRVANPAQPRTATTPPGSGHGLLGMSERVHAAGGHLTIQRPEAGTAGHFVLAAELPIDTEAP